MSAKLWQAVLAVNEYEHTTIELSKAIAATKIEYKTGVELFHLTDWLLDHGNLRHNKYMAGYFSN